MNRQIILVISALYLSLVGCRTPERFPGQTEAVYPQPLSLHGYNAVEVFPVKAEGDVPPHIVGLCQKTILNTIIASDFFDVINRSPRYSTYMPKVVRTVQMRATVLSYTIGEKAPIGDEMTTAKLVLKVQFQDATDPRLQVGEVIFNLESNQPMVGLTLERLRLALEDALETSLRGI